MARSDIERWLAAWDVPMFDELDRDDAGPLSSPLVPGRRRFLKRVERSVVLKSHMAGFAAFQARMIKRMEESLGVRARVDAAREAFFDLPGIPSLWEALNLVLGAARHHRDECRGAPPEAGMRGVTTLLSMSIEEVDELAKRLHPRRWYVRLWNAFGRSAR